MTKKFDHDRDELLQAVPDTDKHSVGDGDEEVRIAFADGFNRVLSVLRSKFRRHQAGFDDDDLDTAKFISSKAWNEFCGNQGDVKATVKWLMDLPEFREKQYQLRSGSGVVVDADAKTLTGAKREATRWMTHGGGAVYVLEDGREVCFRPFWESGSRFGWDKWRAVP